MIKLRGIIGLLRTAAWKFVWEVLGLGISLYRQYRPQQFSDVAGQPAAVEVLSRGLARSRIGHAYLFSGPRGCGKTTVARLLAKALNCLSPLEGYEPCCQCKNCLAITAGECLDVIEIDGASNNSVDEIRELKSHVTLAPFSCSNKIYIIDEVHMLSISAFNALLKTLEEPPLHVFFILATTEAHKVPVTIRSRCQHIPFHRIATHSIYDRLLYVCNQESITCQTEALWEIARQADGGLRDALSMLEQVANLGTEVISLSEVEATLGQGSRSVLERWLSDWRCGNPESFGGLDRMLMRGLSPQRLIEELFSLCRNLWLAAKWPSVLDSLDVSEQEKDYLRAESPFWGQGTLERMMQFLAELLPQARMGLRGEVLAGLLMIKMKVQEAVAEPSKETQSIIRENTLPSVPLNHQHTIVKMDEPQELEPQISTFESEVFPEEEWAMLELKLREKDFTLYCAVLGSDVFIERNETGEELLLIRLKDRYNFDVLALDRYRSALRRFFASLNETRQVFLAYGTQRICCDGRNTAGRPKSNLETSEAVFKAGMPDLSDLIDPKEEVNEEDVRSVNKGSTPFEGLVREVTRWMRGDLLMVRYGDAEDSEEIIYEE